MKNTKGRKVNNPLQNTSKKTTKIDRIFGSDADRIKREAAKISDGARKNTAKSAPSGSKKSKSTTKKR